MDFVTVRDMRTKPKSVWETLSTGEDVVITNNGKPTALMIEIPEKGFEETVRAVRQARAMIAFNTMRKKAAQRGFMSEEEINAEIAAYRTERQTQQ
jgi:antitoxin (DNA-binding transcriptional repressor) of toxin-antitoxin stability system